MTTNILFCGYSFHTNGYHSQHKSGYPSYLFRLQTEGHCEVVVKGRKVNLEKGDLLLIKPGDHYELLVKDGQISGDYHLVCDGTWLDEWWSRSTKPDISRIDLDEKLLALWRHIMIEKRRPASIAKRRTHWLFATSTLFNAGTDCQRNGHDHQSPLSVTRMMRYIEEHATSNFKVEEVALHAGLSVSRSVHLFKSSVGKTMMEYALEIRMSAAIERMKYSSMTLEQIADECGFGAYSYFHRVFKKKYGVAPGEYRRRE